MVNIVVKKGSDPGLKRPGFLCDAILKDDVPKPFDLLVDGYKFCVFIGRPASGKTSFLFSLFKDKRCLKKVWNNIVLVCPEQSVNSIKKKDNIFKDLSEEKFYNTLEDIDQIRAQVKAYASMDENTAVIIDDQMSLLKDYYIEKILCDMVANRRHYRCSIFLTSQIYERIPLKVRKLINVAITMYRPSKKEITLLFDELLEHKQEVADKIYKIAFQKPYDFLLVDVVRQKIFANYNELVISDEDD